MGPSVDDIAALLALLELELTTPSEEVAQGIDGLEAEIDANLLEASEEDTLALVGVLRELRSLRRDTPQPPRGRGRPRGSKDKRPRVSARFVRQPLRRVDLGRTIEVLETP
jgi:hypothetical protein